MTRLLEIASIRTDLGTQMRVQSDQQTTLEYVQAYLDGDDMPPVVVFRTPEGDILADGFHRLEAAEAAKLETIEADVREGTRRDAILYAVGANAHHGLRRTNADKRRAIETLLADDEWCQWSDREIARKTGVHHETVGEVRRATGGIRQSAVRKGADGRTINTANIGGKTRELSPSSSTALAESDDSDEGLIGTDGAKHPTSVNGNASQEPPDIAAQKRMGIIPAGVQVDIDEPDGEASDDEADAGTDLSDAEWLKQFPERRKLSERCQARYDSDALAFRAIAPLRRAYAQKCRPHSNRSKKECQGHIGAWLGRHLSYFRSNGPASWVACDDCKGSGVLDLIGRCPACGGHGYHAR